MHDAGPTNATAGQAPMSNGRLAIMLVVGSEIMLFAGIIAGYVVLRFASGASGSSASGSGIPPSISLPATLLLAAGGLLLIPVSSMIRRGRPVPRLLGPAALLCALGFVLLEGLDWWRLAASDAPSLDVRSGASTLVVGLHLLHALVGLLLLAPIVRSGSAMSERAASRVGIGIYFWLFVTLTWIALIGALSLL